MPSRGKIKVNKLKLTPDQMKAAMDRSSRNVKKMVIWKTPKAFKQKIQDDEKVPA